MNTLVQQLTARALGPRERLPKTAYSPDPILDVLDLDSNWVWVLLDESEEIMGLLVAAPCHGVAHVLRLRMHEKAPLHGALMLMRQFFADCRKRQIKGLFGYFDTGRKEEMRLANIAVRMGGRVLFHAVVAVGAPLTEEGI